MKMCCKCTLGLKKLREVQMKKLIMISRDLIKEELRSNERRPARRHTSSNNTRRGKYGAMKRR